VPQRNVVLAICYGASFVGIALLLAAAGSWTFALITLATVGAGAALGLMISIDKGMLLMGSFSAMFIGFLFFSVHGGWVFLTGIAIFWAGTAAFGVGLGRLLRN
jgi:hypothetical protein